MLVLRMIVTLIATSMFFFQKEKVLSIAREMSSILIIQIIMKITIDLV